MQYDTIHYDMKQYIQYKIYNKIRQCTISPNTIQYKTIRYAT